MPYPNAKLHAARHRIYGYLEETVIEFGYRIWDMFPKVLPQLSGVEVITNGDSCMIG